MKKFERSPSKVWWAEEALNWSQRSTGSTSSSNGSQDSGFSDTETSPSGRSKKKEQKATEQNENKDGIFKDVMSAQNLSSNFKEKSTPKKTSPFYIRKKENVDVCSRRFSSIVETEDCVLENEENNNNSNNRAVNRSLFKNLGANEQKRDQIFNEESSSENDQETQTSDTIITEIENNNSNSSSVLEEVDGCKTYPFLSFSPQFFDKNNTAPTTLININNNNNNNRKEDKEIEKSARKNSLSSSDESELEFLFDEGLTSPKHTSTPKGCFRKEEEMRQKRAKHLYHKYQTERVLRRRMRFENENPSVQKWLEEVRQVYDPECMMMLQCKSVTGDLGQKVSHLANVLTCPLRKLLYMGENIEKEFENIKSQNQCSAPLAQSLSGHIAEFARNFVEDNELLNKCEEIRKLSNDFYPSIENLYSEWNSKFQHILVDHLKKLVCYLEDPRSELELRATLTAITSLTLRNESFASIFASCDTISTLCVLCEKCEASTVRALILRALTTVCNNPSAIRQFERSSGLQTITEILSEVSRPEPERAEALALLAQTTAPWIENNQVSKSLSNNIKQLIKAITRFTIETNCCQNLLLCAATFANLSTLEPKSIKYIINQKSIRYLLEKISEKGATISIYVLEQTAIVLANLAAKKEAREYMIEENVIKVLLYFIQATSEDCFAVKRIQQKSIVALSRLSGSKKAASQILEQGGVSKLATLCRDKERRHDDDGVLVAALATLRKIAEICGTAAIDDEDIQELVQPRLLDSFLTYSTQNESYV